MINLNDNNRLRLLWHFLIKAATADKHLSPYSIHKVFGTTQQDFDRITEICTDHDLPNPIGLIEGQSISHTSFDQDTINRMILIIPEFSQISEEEKQDLEFLSAKYVVSFDQSVRHTRSLYEALDFWQSLNPELLANSIKSQMIRKLIKINELFFADTTHRNNSIAQMNAKFQEFQAFTSDHSFLIIYHKGWSGKLEDIDNIHARYSELQKQVEEKTSDIETYIKNSKKHLDDKASEAMDKHEAIASELVEKAKNHYTKNLLSDYVKNFEKDAERYAQSASRWLQGLFLSFSTTFLIAFYFLGHLKIVPNQLDSELFKQFIYALLMIGSLYLFIVISVSGYFVVKYYIVPSLEETFGIKVNIPKSGTDRIMEAVTIISGFSLFLVVTYLAASYFHITVETPPISAKTFLIPAGSEINWAALLSGATPRFLVLALVAAVTLFCMRMYRIQKHLQSVNQYRVAALASFDTFINALGEENGETKARKDKLFDELANLIYSPIQTGFTDDNQLKTNDLVNLIATAVHNVNQR